MDFFIQLGFDNNLLKRDNYQSPDSPFPCKGASHSYILRVYVYVKSYIIFLLRYNYLSMASVNFQCGKWNQLVQNLYKFDRYSRETSSISEETSISRYHASYIFNTRPKLLTPDYRSSIIIENINSVSYITFSKSQLLRINFLIVNAHCNFIH